MSVRQLSSFEQYFYYRNKLNLYSCIYLAVTLNKIPTRSELFVAVKETINTYPQAYCTVTLGNDGTPIQVVDLNQKPIYFNDVIKYTQWDKFEENEIASIFKTYTFPIEDDKILWKILVNEKTNQIFFVLSHVLFDGMSSTIFATTFMNNLQNVKENVTHENEQIVYQSDQSAKLNKHPYDNWPTPLAWKFKRQVVKLLMNVAPSTIVNVNKRFLQFKNYNLPDDFLLETNNSDYEFSVKNDNIQKLLRINPNKSKKILEMCRTENVSMNSFLISLFFLALKDVSSDVLRNGKIINVSIPINTRNVCKNILDLDDSELQLGDLIIGAEYAKDIDAFSKNQFWDLARDINKYVKEVIEDKVTDNVNVIKLLDVVNVEEFIRKKVRGTYGVGPGAAFEVSNLGLTKFGDNTNDTNKYYITDALFNQPQGFSNIFTCSVISTPLGGLTCSISYPRKLVDDIEPVWKAVDETLEKF